MSQGFGPPTRGFTVAQPSSTDESHSADKPGRRRATSATDPAPGKTSLVKASETASKPPKHVVPEGAILPDRGWPKIQYWIISKLFRRPDKVPDITIEQRRELELNAKLSYKDQLIARLRFLANMGIRPIIVVANIKSAGKSTDSIGMATVIAEYARNMVLLVPSTTNTATATAGLMAGITGDAITVDEYMQNIKIYGAYRALSQKVPRTKNGLGVIVEDSKSAADVDDASKVKLFMEMIDVTIPNVDVLVLDLGNDNISLRSIALQAARLGHVLNFPFLMDNPVTHDTLRRTLDGYNTDAGIPDEIREELYQGFENRSYTGVDITTQDKVEHSIVIANKVPAGTHVDFTDFTRSRSQGASAVDLPTWKGTGIGVPDEPSFARNDAAGTLLPFDLAAIKLETEISYLEAAVANFEVTGFQTKVAIGTPMVANIPSLAESGNQEGGVS